MSPEHAKITTARNARAGLFDRGQRLNALVFLLVALAMGLSGLLALQAGTMMHPLPLLQPDEAAERAGLLRELREGQPLSELGASDLLFHIGAETALVTAATSTPHIVASLLPDHAVYYASMPDLNIVLLSLHTTLAAFCMLVGAFQFWPAFRRRHPQLHRRFGMIYVLTAVPSTLLAMAYLVVTPPSGLVTGLTGYVALWLIAVLVLIAITLAMVHLRRREIGQHQAWMALGFGLLMVAPLLRWNWVLLAQILPAVEHETLNLCTLILLVPEALLISHLLLVLNRRQQRLRPLPLTVALGERVRAHLGLLTTVVAALALACLAAVIARFLVAPGLEQMASARDIVPLAVLRHEAAVLGDASMSRWLHVLTAGGALLLIPPFFRRAFSQPHGQPDRRLRLQALTLALAIVGAGLSEMYWGWQLGVPVGMSTLTGGTFYMSAGLLSLTFSGLLALAALRGQLSGIKEWGLFTLLAATFMPVFHGSLMLLSWLPWPAEFITNGQLYVLACGTPLFLLLAGFIYSVYGQTTRERFAV